MKYIETSKYVLMFEGTFIDDKTGMEKILLTNGDGIKWANTGTYVHHRGGIQNVMNELKETDKTIEQLRNEQGKALAPTAEQKKITHSNQLEYKRKVDHLNECMYSELKSNELNECTPGNICVILRHANRTSDADLPKMNIGYTIRTKQKVGRDGLKITKNYSIMDLNEPIEYNGEQCAHFIFGMKSHLDKESGFLYRSVLREDGIEDFNE